MAAFFSPSVQLRDVRLASDRRKNGGRSSRVCLDLCFVPLVLFVQNPTALSHTPYNTCPFVFYLIEYFPLKNASKMSIGKKVLKKKVIDSKFIDHQTTNIKQILIRPPDHRTTRSNELAKTRLRGIA